MRIEDYFRQVREMLDACPLIESSSVTYDERASYEGFIQGELYLRDGSVLHFREFVDVETTVERLLYSYQYMTPAPKLVFRYDNTGHHRKMGLATYPHHKHEGEESRVVASQPSDLSQILSEIETLYGPGNGDPAGV